MRSTCPGAWAPLHSPTVLIRVPWSEYIRLKIAQAHKTGRLAVSFELFPPRDADGETHLFEVTIPALAALKPTFMTCTYGAGGSTQRKTLEIVTRVKQQTGLEAASHLTCVGASRDQLRDYLSQARENGITNIVALRGDPPKGDAEFKPHPDGLAYAVELVKLVRSMSDFDIAVAGYPEGHPECPDKHIDWQHHRDKVEAGADMIITQLFYDNRDFFEFDDYLKNKLGVKVPIVPGILPVQSGQQIRRFCNMCGAKLPEQMMRRLDELSEDKAGSRAYGVELATAMCEELIRYGVPGFHFYTLNRVHSTQEVLENLGLVPR